MARIGRLNVEVGADTKRMRGDLAKAAKEVGKFKRDLHKSGRLELFDSKRIDSFTGGIAKLHAPLSAIGKSLFAVGAAAGAASIGLGLMAKEQIDLIGDQADAAKKLGLTRNELVTLQRAGKAVGIDNDKLTASFEKMSDVLGSAFRGDAGAVKTLERIGVNVKSLEAMNPAQRFMAIGKAIDQIQDPATKISAARDVFGKAGGDMTNLFEGGAAAIREAAAELNTLGVLLSDFQLASIERAGDVFDKMGTAVDGVKTQLAAGFSPLVEKIGRDLEAWVQSIGGVPAAMDLAIKKFGEGADASARMGGSVVAAGKTAVDVKKGTWDKGKELLGSIPGGGMLGDVLSWNPVRDTVGAIYGKHKSDQALAAMQDKAALRMKTGAKPQTAVGAAKKYLSDAQAEATAISEGKPLPTAATAAPSGTPSYADWKSGRPRDPDYPKYLEKAPSARKDYLDKIPMGQPAYKSKMGDAMTGAVAGNPTAVAMEGGIVKELQRTNALLEKVATNTKGPTVGALA